ncbi:hypothetical protein [Companilactobacillus zhachilii]|uniref:hypothetical protein n=1 Tax=Companilactobacillus zhachilii TaxID=2304606 RepID=UPI00141FB334|nr:hypothetical protein [Companilactobacillus zhachilii]
MSDDNELNKVIDTRHNDIEKRYLGESIKGNVPTRDQAKSKPSPTKKDKNN